jgi:hypothetical protein
MSDNTLRNEGQIFHDESGPLARVREGMPVVDATGQKLGTVEHVKMGNPDTATARGSVQGSADPVLEIAASVFGGEADVPEPKRSQLLRYGFIRIDGSGLSDTDRFVRSDKIRDVVDDTVYLTMSKDQLIAEQ